MKLNATCPIMPGAGLSAVQGKAVAAAQAQSPLAPQAATDRLELSQQACDKLAERLRAVQQAQAQAERVHEQAMQDAENARKTAEAMAKWLDTMLKCMKIAARIMAGDTVPPEDARFLLKNDPKTYQMAMAQRIPKEDPVEHKSVLDNQDREGQAVTGIDGCSAASESASDLAAALDTGGQSA